MRVGARGGSGCGGGREREILGFFGLCVTGVKELSNTEKIGVLITKILPFSERDGELIKHSELYKTSGVVI